MIRTTIILCILGLILNLSNGIGSSSSERTASPPIIPVVIDKVDPVPAGLPAKLTYEGRGGGPPYYAAPPQPTGIHWQGVPPLIDYPMGNGGTNDMSLAFFTACGYISNEPPLAALTLPSGRQESLPGTRDQYSSGCWNYTVDWSYGIELGIYHLMLTHAEGNLEYTWGIDYPYCKVATPLLHDNGTQILLMGLPQNETIVIHIYQDVGISTPYGDDVGYVTSKTIKVNSVDGAAILSLQVAPQAASSFSSFFAYTVLDSHGQLLGNTTPSAVFYGTKPYIPRVAQAKYSTYETSSYPCDGQFYRFAQVDVKNGGQLPLYAQFNETSTVSDHWNSGIPVEILEQQPAMLNQRVVMWYRLRNEQGQEGWSYGTDFLYSMTRLISGSKAEVLPTTTYDTQTKQSVKFALYLRQKPESNATIIRTLPSQSQITLHYKRDYWWYISTADGLKGWVYSYDDLGEQILLGLPWMPSEQ